MTRRTTSRAPEMFPGRQPSSHLNPCLGGVCSRYAGSERAPGRSWTAQNDGCQAGSRDGFGWRAKGPSGDATMVSKRDSHGPRATRRARAAGRGPPAAPPERAHSTPSAHELPGPLGAGPGRAWRARKRPWARTRRTPRTACTKRRGPSPGQRPGAGPHKTRRGPSATNTPGRRTTEFRAR
jgi:hypothetical protein